MKGLNKQRLKDKKRIEDALRESFSKLESAIEEFNTTLDQEWQKVQEAVDAHNAKVTEANEFSDEVSSEINDYIGDKSDNWQEGDRGQVYASWQESWEAELEEIDLEKPTEIDVPDENVADTFGDLPNEPEL